YEPPLWITQEISRANPDFHHGLLGESISDFLPNATEVIDDETCSLHKRDRPQFKNLLFRRGNPPCFLAFDLLICDGKDRCTKRLIDRKQELRRLLAQMSVTPYLRGRPVLHC